MDIRVEAAEAIRRTVGKSGNGGTVPVPVAWLHDDVLVLRLNRDPNIRLRPREEPDPLNDPMLP